MDQKEVWIWVVVIAIVVAAYMLWKTGHMSSKSEPVGQAEARILRLISQESKRPIYTPQNRVQFPAIANVFVNSALAIDFTYRDAWVRLPLYRGCAGNGDTCYFILTEASDPQVAMMMGVNFAPRMANIGDGKGYQRVTVDKDGVIQFRGNVNFNRKHQVLPGVGSPFPPLMAQAGGIADAAWSSFVILPDGVVLNTQVVHNKTGYHDRIRRIDVGNCTVDMIMLNGYQGGKEYFYHLVTDVSVELPAALENGYVAPRLAKIPTFASTGDESKSAVFAFSPVLNGPTVLGQEQGFVVSIANKGIDPINVFPAPPNNSDTSASNLYSPMWDAHVSEWTPTAIQQGLVRRIKGFEDLKALVSQGLVTSAYINPPGPSNPTLFGLRATQALINCPVIALPVLPEQ